MTVAAPPEAPRPVFVEEPPVDAQEALIEEARQRARRRRMRYAGCGGIRLITPTGVDATPESPPLGCRGSTPVRRGGPVWSPDNRKLAVANALGVFVIDLRTRTKDAEELLTPSIGSRETGLGIFRTAQPSWRATR